MGNIIDFPACDDVQEVQAEVLENDPYYLFIRNVLATADSCGFELPFTVDSAAEHVYRKTRETSQLAKMLDKDLNT